MPSDLRSIRTFEQLIRYLGEELDWPIEDYELDELAFTYDPAELGLKDEDAAAIKPPIRQLRPLSGGQPWGVFFVEFEKKRLPVVVLRRILSHLVVKKRASANTANAKRWNAEDLLFISAFGQEVDREIAFAHFHQESGDLPTLRVLGWDGGNTALTLESVAQTLQEKLHWPEKEESEKQWRERWSGAFRHRIGHRIRTADELAEKLASLARGIRDRAKDMIAAESDRGPLTKLFKAFQTALIHDLTPATFADTYAQTITYGLLTAAINRTDMSGGAEATYVKADDLTLMVRVTSPFLKEMLETFLTVGGRRGAIDFDELGIQDVVELLRGDETDLPAVIKDFGHKNPEKDPVIHFYEHFLRSYDPGEKKKRGVFYTPPAVVSFIVRNVHELLQEKFGLEDGLASTITWGEIQRQIPGLTLPKVRVRKAGDSLGEETDIPADTAFVQILDPATGTATFLVEVIDIIHTTLTRKWRKDGRSEAEQEAAWNEYVPKHLLPRLHGYELLAAPYAIAHLKMGLKLTETGYRFRSEQRARIYLTNALESANEVSDQLEALAPALAHEAKAVNRIKRFQRFTIVIGNPPYSKASQNLGEQFLHLIERFRSFSGERIREPGAILFERDINNDYVKFIGLYRLLIEASGTGVLGVITSNSYLDGKNFRGVRDGLAGSFSNLSVLNLHGDSRSGVLARQGVVDENVFDIETGVCILLASRMVPLVRCTQVAYAEITGTFEEKASLLLARNSELHGKARPIDDRRYKSFIPTESAMLDEYAVFPRLDGMFQLAVDGIKTSRDGLVIANTRAECAAKIQAFMNFAGTDSDLEETFGINVSKFDYQAAQKHLRKSFSEERIFKLAYRPFDFRYIYYDPAIVFSHRQEKMVHLVRGENFALVCASRLSGKGFNHILPADSLVEMKYASHDTNSRVFPVLLFEDGLSRAKGRPNIGKAARQIGGAVDTDADWTETVEAIFAVLNANKYRARFLDEIKNDFPGIPPLMQLGLRDALAALGRRLMTAQLLKPAVPDSSFRFVGTPGDLIKTPRRIGDRLYLSPNGYFEGVSDDLFKFTLAGYNICKNWVSAGNKSGIQRKGTTLTNDQIEGYRRVLFGIQETLAVRAAVDRLIEAQAGW
jgi:predicted helicase